MVKKINVAVLCLAVLATSLIAAVLITHYGVNNAARVITPNLDSWESRYLIYDDGWYINDRIFGENGLTEEVEIIYGPFVYLKQGSYYAMVDYETNFDQSLRIYAFENEDKIIPIEETILPADGRQACYRFSVTEDIDNFEIRVLYSGEGSLKINNIRVFDEKWGLIYHLRNLIATFGMVFLVLTIIAFRPGIYAVNPKRELWVDMARGIGIILVFLGHSTGNPLCWFIYGFHMPLFFILSGYLFKQEKLGIYTVKLVRRYLVPYLVFCFANSILRIPYMLVGEYTLSGIKNVLIAYWIASLKGRWQQMPNCMPLWFLPALAVALLLFRIIKMIPLMPVRIALYIACAVIGYNWKTLMAMAGVPVELPWGQHTICTDVAFIAIGHGFRMIYSRYKDRYDSLQDKRRLVIIGSFLAAGLMCVIADHFFFNDVDIYFNSYGNILLTYAGATCMSLFVILLCMFLSIRISPANALVVIGYNSIFFFAFDFWGKVLALYSPKIIDHEWWLTTFVLKFIFVSLLFVIWKNIRSFIKRI